jgi:hypothetical protein
MNRRELMGTLGATAASLTALQAFGQEKAAKPAFAGDKPEKGQDPASHAPMHGDDPIGACAKACSDCQRACDSCTTHCVSKMMEGAEEHKKTYHTCIDCADFCSTAAQIVARRGVFSDLICQSCADACARCAKACDAHKDDKMMQMCAEECRKCEKACREMVKVMGQHHKTAEQEKAKL